MQAFDDLDQDVVPGDRAEEWRCIIGNRRAARLPPLDVCDERERSGAEIEGNAAICSSTTSRPRSLLAAPFHRLDAYVWDRYLP